MTIGVYALVAVGAAIGAPVRYLVDRRVQRGVPTRLPLGTLVVNLAGSFLIGVLAGWPHVSLAVVAAVGTGFCGALTTFSALSWEAFVLAQSNRWRAVGLLGFSAVAGLGAAALGWALVGWLVAG